ncbi:MAG: polymer-forming cytoskeletal family protein [Spirochaetes bacterium]|nr:MAG: polymer-forming cytoskeletal family protein [Spirochaetota bacterium]
MSDHLDTSGVFINSIIGEGTSFSGDILLSGLIRIDGDFKGSITTEGKVLIGKNGRAECMIKADTVVIGGVVKGDIISSDKVVILSTGMLIGNIAAPRLVAEEGVILNGMCTISNGKIPTEPEETSGDKEVQDDLERYNPEKKVFSLWKG